MGIMLSERFGRKNGRVLVISTCALTLFICSLVLRREPQVLQASSQPSHPQPLHVSRGVCEQGRPPLTHAQIKEELSSFLAVYNTRLGINNPGGTRLMHQFGLWCFVRALKPRYIIESGIYRGLGTWILRQAAPTARIILVDPKPQRPLAYRDEGHDTLYLTDRNFTDFGAVEWRKFVEPTQTLVFIDDHQNPIRRVLEAKQAGFPHVMFDDNYAIGDGDVISLRASCGLLLGHVTRERLSYKDRKGRSLMEREVTENDVETMRHTFDQIIDTYYEFPMIWNVSQTASTNRNNENILFPGADAQELLLKHGLRRFPPPKELRGYYNLAYVKLK